MLTHHHNTDGAAAQLGTVTVTRGGTMLKIIVAALYIFQCSHQFVNVISEGANSFRHTQSAFRY